MFQPQTLVRAFMKMAGQSLPEKPTVADEATRKLRVKLNLEETLELAEASAVRIIVEPEDGGSGIDVGRAFQEGRFRLFAQGTANLKEMADAIADLTYVNEGAANAFGLDQEPFFNEVHRSNMTKKWTLLDINQHLNIHEGLLSYKGESVTVEKDPDAQPGDLRIYIVKNTSGKMVKSPSYEEADLEKVLQDQIGCGGKCTGACKQ